MRPRHFLCLAFLLAAAASAQNDLQNTLVACLGATGATVVLPNDPAYGAARQSYNRLFQTWPLAVVYPNTVADVQQAVNCAARYSVRLIPRSGCHSTMGLSVRQGAITLDLSRMHNVTVSPDASNATAQAGALIGQIYYAAATASNGTKGFPAGVCPNVGVGGHVPGGGLGYLTRAYGLACDQVLAVKMVTASGDLITADSSQNQDLLWAACGSGGGSLGVVVEYTVKLVDVPTTVTTWSAFARMEEGAAAAAFYQDWGPQLPREMGTFLNFIMQRVILSGLYLGHAEEAQRVLQDSGIFDAPIEWLPGSFNLTESSWLEAAASLSGDPYYKNISNMAGRAYPYPHEPGSGFASKSKSYNVIDPLPEDALEALAHFANYTPGGWVAFQAWGGHMAEVAQNATAFWWRDARMNIFYLTSWPAIEGPELAASGMAYLAEAQAALAPYIPLQASYLNYPDTELAAWPRAYWGGNAERLQEVKRQLDPTDFFTNELVLTTAMPLPAL